VIEIEQKYETVMYLKKSIYAERQDWNWSRRNRSPSRILFGSESIRMMQFLAAPAPAPALYPKYRFLRKKYSYKYRLRRLDGSNEKAHFCSFLNYTDFLMKKVFIKRACEMYTYLPKADSGRG
jgi:hypothetical protein